ncbi:HK97-gp10 family putative phage morphogenesis protein [Streptomyces decoyicus]|uniref:HK97-gp10 family putative phage morphogenesis protein n=1 Tax=Streptomyces decoyicus TaxID=249567 RepID=UPI00380F80CA
MARRYFDTSASARIDSRAYERGLRRYLGRMSDDVRKAVERTGTDVQNQARRLAPVDTGRLRSSIVARRTTGRGVGYEVGTNVNYARDVEFGTAPHVITPKNGKALYWPGAAHPVAKVNHPGTRAQPFLRPAIEMTDFFFRFHMAGIRGGR